MARLNPFVHWVLAIMCTILVTQGWHIANILYRVCYP